MLNSNQISSGRSTPKTQSHEIIWQVICNVAEVCPEIQEYAERNQHIINNWLRKYNASWIIFCIGRLEKELDSVTDPITTLEQSLDAGPCNTGKMFFLKLPPEDYLEIFWGDVPSWPECRGSGHPKEYLALLKIKTTTDYYDRVIEGTWDNRRSDSSQGEST